MHKFREFPFAFLLLLMPVVVVILYSAGLSGVFLVDDVWNLSALNDLGGVTDWNSFKYFVFSNESGPLGRPVSMLSFLIDDQYYPGSVESYRYTNVLIHNLCGILLYILVRQILGVLVKRKDYFIDVVALISVFWWLLAPINVSTTLYVVQRMTQLSTLFSLMGLIFYLKGRFLYAKGVPKGFWWSFFGLYVCGFFAVFSKENGALIFFYAVSIELAFVSAGLVFLRRYLILLAPPVASISLYLIYRMIFSSDSAIRDFSNAERLLTEFRILWDYILKILMPISGKMGLIQDDYKISKALLQPWTTIFSLFGHILLVTIAWLNRKKFPIGLLAVSWYYFGHLIESTVIPLELYFEHRNYMPSMMLLVAVVFAVVSAESNRVLWRSVFFVLIVSTVFVFVQRVNLWGHPVQLLNVWAAEHPDSIRAQTMNVRSLSGQRKYIEAERELERLNDKWPQAIHLYLVLINQSCSGNMSYKYSEYDFSRALERAEYHPMLQPIMENSVRLYAEKKCDFLDANFMHRLLGGVAGFSGSTGSAVAIASYLNAQVYESERDLSGTLEYLEVAFKYQPESFLLFRRAKILFSAGLLELSLEELDRAIEFELKLPAYRRIRLNEYMKSREALISKLQGKNINV